MSVLRQCLTLTSFNRYVQIGVIDVLRNKNANRSVFTSKYSSSPFLHCNTTSTLNHAPVKFRTTYCQSKHMKPNNHCFMLLNKTPRLRPNAFNFLNTKSSSLALFCFGTEQRNFHTSPIYEVSNVTLTRDRYPNLQRGSFATIVQQDIDFFEGIIPGCVITDADELTGYNTDWLRTVRGDSQVLLRPKTTAEIAAIVKYCNDHCLAIVPQGGNTGLVGGSVPVFDEVIISMQLMNEVISLDNISGTLVCQAGCILETLDSYVQEYGFTMPLDLGAKGSCHIGGNVSTNAGGIRYLRYGSLHGNVLGLEAVLPSGEIIDNLSTLRKDNTGYDLKQLFIGSEGTLGIITAVSLICPQKPKSVSVAFLGSDKFSDILALFKSCKGHLGEILSAFEFMDAASMKMVNSNLGLTSPLEQEFPFYALVECRGSNTDHDEEKMNGMLEHVLEQGQALDGTVATDFTKIQYIWSLRERCAEALMVDGYCYKYDVSLPLLVFYKLVEHMRARVEGTAIRTIGYGHVGDGNLHLNMTTREYCPTTMSLIEPFIYDWVAEHRGSVSAEHGLGFKKRNFIYHTKSPAAVRLMATIKSNFDPKGIMNPYKVLPEILK